MIKIISTEEFSTWLSKLRDSTARTKIIGRIDRVRFGNFGDFKPVGEKVFELRVDYGPGYRVYYTRKGDEIVFLTNGGSKSRQGADIERAKVLAEKFHKGEYDEN